MHFGLCSRFFPYIFPRPFGSSLTGFCNAGKAPPLPQPFMLYTAPALFNLGSRSYRHLYS